MSDDLKIKETILEEQTLLSKVVVHLTTSSRKSSAYADYDAELIELRDAIAEALPEIHCHEDDREQAADV